MKKKIRIPILPLTALIFYLTVLILRSFNVIPPPNEIVIFLEILYENYGLIGFFIASFLEGIVYLGLYFPGTFIIILAVIFSDGGFTSIFSMSIIVTIALLITSIINYVLGRHIVSKKEKTEELKKSKSAAKGLILSCIHPNALAFYFFNLGLKKRSPYKILYVPIIILPYSLIIFSFIYSIKTFARKAAENPYALITMILIWFIIAFIFENKKEIKKELKKQGRNETKIS